MADVVFFYVKLLLIYISHSKVFVAVEHVPTPTDNQLSKYLKLIMKIYFIIIMLVQTVLMGK